MDTDAMTGNAAAKRGWLAALTLSVVAVLITDFLTWVFHLETSFLSWGIAAVLFFLVALLIGTKYGLASGSNILFIALGIALGGFVDALLVEVFFDQSRNLWPIGIVIWWVIGAVPIALGFVVASLWRGRVAT